MKKNKILKMLITGIIFFSIHLSSYSQVLISGSTGTPNSSAMLDIESTSKGLLIPRMTTAQRTG
ncbi:MAG: hypothetical protein L3J35_08830, partial [Bacteroidales bacterium]|nr:hypothetical protein [Bacteroidales bacterium]